MKRNFGIFIAMLLGGAVAAQTNEGINVGGYVDAQYNYATIKNSGGTSGTAGEKMANTFRFSEAALTASKKVGGAEGVLDIAVHGPSRSYTKGFVSSTTDTAWDIGQTGSQAYVAMNYDNGFMWRLGQFDSLFGYEANDSADQRYAMAGSIAAHMPVTQVGFHGKYEFSDMLTVHVAVANPSDLGYMYNGNLQYGIKLNTKFDAIKFNIGSVFMTGDSYSTGAKEQLGYLVDWDLSSKMASVDWALYGFFSKNDIKNAKLDYGVGLDLGYAVTEMVDAGLRVEFDKDGQDNGTTNTITALATDDDQTIQVTVGPQFHLTDNLTAKLDYTFKKLAYDASTAKDEQGHYVNLAAVYKF
jgi:hypothetical protein